MSFPLGEPTSRQVRVTPVLPYVVQPYRVSPYVLLHITPLGKDVASAAFLSSERVRVSQCYPIVSLNSSDRHTLCWPCPTVLKQGGTGGLLQSAGRGQLLWRFGRDSYSSVSPTYVECDRLNGNVSVATVAGPR